MSRDELIVVVRRQAGQIRAQAGQIAELMEANEALAARLARLEHLLSRNSGNSSNPPSKDDDPGKPAPPDKQRGRGGPKRSRGKQPGAPGTHLAWTDTPNEQQDRFPEGRCDCGHDLAGARDLGVVDRYQQHEIPQVAVTITQYDQHRVECGCGRRHTAARPDGARPGPVGYGPNLAAFAVYLMVVHFIPAHRVVTLLESLTGTAPSVGFVHGMISRAAGLLDGVHQRIRTLVTLAYAVCCDETPLRVGPRTPAAGKKKAERGPLGAPPPPSTHTPPPRRHRALHPLPARRPIPDHVQGLRGGRAGRLGDRARPVPELRLRRPRRAGPPVVHRAPAARSGRRRAGLPRQHLAGPDRRRAARADR